LAYDTDGYGARSHQPISLKHSTLCRRDGCVLRTGSLQDKQQQFVSNKAGVTTSVANDVSLKYVSTAELLCSQA